MIYNYIVYFNIFYEDQVKAGAKIASLGRYPLKCTILWSTDIKISGDIMEIVSKEEQKTILNRIGKGGEKRIISIKDYQFELVMLDEGLVTERDRIKNKINQKDGKTLLHPTLAERIERIVDKFYNLNGSNKNKN